MRAHLENVHPNEHAMMSRTATEKPRLDDFSPTTISSLSVAIQEASFICKDMRPIGIADGTGFREFCQELELRYRIPKIPIQIVMSRCIGLYSCYCHNAQI